MYADQGTTCFLRNGGEPIQQQVYHIYWSMFSEEKGRYAKQPECVYRIIRDIVFFEKSSGQDQWVYRRCLVAYYNMPTPVFRQSHAARG